MMGCSLGFGASLSVRFLSVVVLFICLWWVAALPLELPSRLGFFLLVSFVSLWGVVALSFELPPRLGFFLCGLVCFFLRRFSLGFGAFLSVRFISVVVLFVLPSVGFLSVGLRSGLSFVGLVDLLFFLVFLSAMMLYIVDVRIAGLFYFILSCTFQLLVFPWLCFWLFCGNLAHGCVLPLDCWCFSVSSSSEASQVRITGEKPLKTVVSTTTRVRRSACETT